MDDKQRDEELVARAYIDALQRAGPPTHAPSSHQAAQPHCSADVLSMLGLLGRLSGDSGAAHPCLAQRSAQSAFHSYAVNSAPQRQPVVEPVEAEPVQKHLEAVSFWIQLYQIATSGLRAALQQASQASFPALPALDVQDGSTRSRAGATQYQYQQQQQEQQQAAAHIQQLAALLQGGLPSTGTPTPPMPHQHLLQQALASGRNPGPSSAQQQQQHLPGRQGFFAEGSMDRVPAQQSLGFPAERSLDRLAPSPAAAAAAAAAAVAPMGFTAERSMERAAQLQQQAVAQHHQSPSGFYAERSLDRVTQQAQQQQQPAGFYAERSLDRITQQHQQAGAAGGGAFKAERSLERPGGGAAPGAFGAGTSADPDSVVGFGKDWSLDPSDQSQEQLRKRARRDENKVCSNCGTNSTPFWRKDRHTGLALCNACGLYAAKNDHPRPVKLWGPGGPPLTAAPQVGTAAAAREPGTVAPAAAAAPPNGSSPELGRGGTGAGGAVDRGSPAEVPAAQLGLTAQQYAAAAAAAAAAAHAGEAERGGEPDKRQTAERGPYPGQQLLAQQAGLQGGSQPRILLSNRVGLEVSRAPAAAYAPAQQQAGQEHVIVEERQGPLVLSPAHGASQAQQRGTQPPAQPAQHAQQEQAHAAVQAQRSPAGPAGELGGEARQQAPLDVAEGAAAMLAAAFAAAAAAARASEEQGVTG
ncbi:hypothetical protein N2152v2_004001 [Parachlorella kessleri]